MSSVKYYKMEKGYKSRREAIREVCRVFVIVCEGKTERAYFNSLRKRECNLIIKTPSIKATDPINLVKFAKAQISKYDLDFDHGDEVWCVFDVDRNTDNTIDKALREAGNDVKIALSNPSFEVWYLLHFVYFTNSINNSALLNSLEKYIPNYKKTEDYSRILNELTSAAIKNAKKLNDFHKRKGIKLNSISSNPSSQIFEVVEHIIKIVTCSI